MHRLSALLLAVLIVGPAASQDVPAIRYEIGWGAPNDHWLDVTMHVDRHEGDVLDVRIPYWRPGRYVVQNYAKDIVGVAARSASGTDLPVRKIDRNTWRIATGNADRVVVSYRQWADQLDAGASYVGQGRLSLNPITALMNVPGRDTEAVALGLDLPEGWSVATALDYDPAIDAWPAADYHELVDSPFLASPDQVTYTFEAGGATFEIVVHGEWEHDPDRLVDHHRRIVEAQVAIMQDVPFDRYVFLYQFLPYMSGHGVEHRNSTSVVLGPASMVAMPEDLSEPGWYGAVLGVASHEFFHAWNVERIRPEAMVPTDYSREQYTSQMWIFEGITSYYGDLALLRGRLQDERVYLERLAQVMQAFDQDPGRKVTSVAMSSFDSWAKQDDPPPFTFYSFYTAGNVLGMALDLEVRARTGGERSLDDVMRYLYDTYYRAGRGVPENGFRLALESVAGSFFEAFFADHVDGTQDVDWNAYLGHAGLRLVERPDTVRSVALGVGLDGMKITSVRPGSAAFDAGLDVDDVIVSLDGDPVEADGGLALSGRLPGDTVTLGVDRYGQPREVLVTLDPAPPVYRIERVADATEAQQALREAWLRRTVDR